MIEVILLALLLGLVITGSGAIGIFFGFKMAKVSNSPKWFVPPVATERAQAIKERTGEDEYLKNFMDAYGKGIFMSKEDYVKGEQKNG